MTKPSIKKISILMIAAGFLVLPAVMSVYAQDAPEETGTQETQSEENQEQAPQETNEQPEQVTEPDQTVVEEDEQPLENEDTQEDPAEITLNIALRIAQAEHPDSEVVMAKVKLKKLSGEKVYKFVFADGWRIYVRASDGEIVRIKDNSNKKHNCSDRGRKASANWRKQARKHKNSRGRKHGYHKNHWNSDNENNQPNDSGRSQDNSGTED